MIHNQLELTREVGSKAVDLKVQRSDIQQAVRKHTENDVWAYLTPNYVVIRSNVSPAQERLAYPFTSDTFWKAVEFIQEEGLEWDEDDEE